MPNVKPYWVLVAGLLLLLAVVLLFVTPRLGPGGTRRVWLGPGGTHTPMLGPGGTYHPYYEPFADGGATYYMVGTSWCPHCVNAKPKFEALGTTVTTSGGKMVAVKYIDGEKEKAAIPAGLKVSGYPTFALVTADGQVKPANGGRETADHRRWLDQNVA
jgi:thiol-disulfide isomerase/thioredoxin